MPEHSPEPWVHTGAPLGMAWKINDANGNLAVRPEDCGTVENFDRIVAAVNFCRHMSTEFLQQHRMVPIKSKDDITTDKGRPDFSEFHPAALIAVVAEAEIAKGKVDAQS
jgi:hypothetical protein